MKKGVIALLACVFALSLALVGCGGAGGGDVKSAWVGTWDLYEMEENGQLTSSDDVELLKSYGIDVYLELNEDGTGSLVLFNADSTTDGEWEAASTTSGTFTAKGQTIDMSIADGKLIMEQGGTKFTFVAGEARTDASASSESASS